MSLPDATKRRWASIAERMGRAFIGAFVAQLLASGVFDAQGITNVSLWAKAAIAGGAAVASLIMSLVGSALPGTNTDTPSLLPAKLDPATNVWDATPMPSVDDESTGFVPQGAVANVPDGPPEMAARAFRMPVAEAATPYPLGRNLRHDSRSRQYALAETAASLKSVRWTRRVPVFDQGNLGSCVGNAAAGWLGTDNAARLGLTVTSDGKAVSEALAVYLYSAATNYDDDPQNYPPNDTGTDSLAAGKALKAAGYCTEYLHAFSPAAVYAALQNGPGMVGTVWYNSMFDTAADGHIKVDAKSGVAGGHEYIVDAVEVDSTGQVTRVWITNSWGTGWSLGGRAYLTRAEFEGLLGASGDFLQPVPVAVAGPVVSPTPAPGPVSPTPAPIPVADPDGDLWLKVKAWAKAGHGGANEQAARAVLAWAKSRGYS